MQHVAPLVRLARCASEMQRFTAVPPSRHSYASGALVDTTLDRVQGTTSTTSRWCRSTARCTLAARRLGRGDVRLTSLFLCPQWAAEGKYEILVYSGDTDTTVRLRNSAP